MSRYRFQQLVFVEVFPNIWKIAQCTGTTHYDLGPEDEPLAVFSFGENGVEHSSGTFVEGEYRTMPLPDPAIFHMPFESHKSESWYKQKAEEALHDDHDCWDEQCPGRV